MRKQVFPLIWLVVLASLIQVSCKKETSSGVQKVEHSAFNHPNSVARESKKVNVSNVDDLYAAINDPANVGSEIVLAPGTYLLNPNYPKAGRLELLHDMSLTGQPGNPEQVIIDATNLPNSSLFPPPTPGIPSTNRTGVIRMGNGKNALEWLTIQNNPSHNIRSLVQTDIVATTVTQIRIAHTIIKGSSIGVSIINGFAIASGRTIEAELEDNEIMDNTIPAFTAGVQIQNSNGANDASIFVTLRRNYIHGNGAGIIAFNGSTQRSIVAVKSYSDKIESNGIGVISNGGFLTNNGTASNNLVEIDVYSTTIKNNIGIPSPPNLYTACGVWVAGAESFPPFGLPGGAHNNKLNISFHGCIIEHNGGPSAIIAYGGHSFHPFSTPVGTYNTANIYLHGVSANATVSATPSDPVEPAGTNTINVYK